jgi:LAS superfamily LD-carboxypeptidase LdcB
MATAYASMPKAWSNKNKVERLRTDAYESLTRLLNRAVAETGVNFSIWSALRTRAEQVAPFTANYRNTGRSYKASGSDRWYGGNTWARRPGRVAVASPDLGSNHQTGVAIDIHPPRSRTGLRGCRTNR